MAATKRRARPPATRTVTPGGRPMGAQPQQRREITPRQAAAAPGNAAVAVTQRGRYTAKHMLTAELIVGVLIVAVRAVADYEPQADGTIKGKVGHPKGQYGPLPILAGLIVSFFLLSFLAASGGLKGKLAVIAGAIIDLGLLYNSATEFTKVSDTFGHLGKAKVPPGSWQTSGDISGQPISGNLPAGGTVPPPGSQSGGNPVKPGKDGKCPAGYGLLNGVCVPQIAPGPPLN